MLCPHCGKSFLPTLPYKETNSVPSFEHSRDVDVSYLDDYDGVPADVLCQPNLTGRENVNA